MTPVAQTRYKISLHIARTKTVRLALLLLELDFPGREIGMNIHDKAPEFTLQDENGREVSSKDLRGKTVVLYFYPRADTPG
jgi:cytochrome oxidase Cu insertion factor (SCO1/SenC/PrrC family)